MYGIIKFERRMYMYCGKCGKQLADGETCSCTAEVNVAGENTEVENENIVLEENTVSSGQKFIAGAHNVMKSASTNPSIKEGIASIKRFIFSGPESELAVAAKRTDMLWVFLLIVETVINSLLPLITIRHMMLSAARKIIHVSYWDFSSNLSESGLGFFSTLLKLMLLNIIVFFAIAGIMFAICIIKGKKAGFSKACNVTAIALLPVTLFAIVGLVVGLFFPSLALGIGILGMLLVIVLCYVGLQQVGNFETVPFCFFAVGVFAFEIVIYIFSNAMLKSLLSSVVGFY